MLLRQVVEVVSDNCYLSTKDNSLALEKDGQKKVIPFEFIESVVLTNIHSVITITCLSALASAGIPVVFCSDKYIPCGMMITLTDNVRSGDRLRLQIEASEPLKKRIWQQIVVAKINNQADVLHLLGKDATGKYLKNLASAVLSGDKSNCEGVAARAYFSSIFGNDFTREDECALNACLNYGYTVLRASVARHIVGSGLNPSLSFMHSSRINPFALVDDLMEPFRPFMDFHIVQLFQNETIEELTPPIKRCITNVLAVNCKMNVGKVCVAKAIEFEVESITNSLIKKKAVGQFPTLLE